MTRQGIATIEGVEPQSNNGAFVLVAAFTGEGISVCLSGGKKRSVEVRLDIEHGKQLLAALASALEYASQSAES